MIRLSSSQITSETADRFSWYLVTRGHSQIYPYNESSALHWNTLPNYMGSHCRIQ